MNPYTSKRKSNYDGFKSLDKMLEKIDSGKLKPPRENQRDYLCPLCSYRKRSMRLVKSVILGKPVAQLPIETEVRFEGRFVLVCWGCADDLERARVA